MELSEKHHEYWRRNLRITAVLMIIWFIATYVMAYFAPQLNQITIIGFPVGFYMAAQGTLIIFVIEIFYYAHYMNKLDNEFGVAEEE